MFQTRAWMKKKAKLCFFSNIKNRDERGRRPEPKPYAVCQDFLRLNSVFNNIYGFHLIISEIFGRCRIFEQFQKKKKKCKEENKNLTTEDNDPYGYRSF